MDDVRRVPAENHYSVPKEADTVFREKILLHPLVSKYLPDEAFRVANKLRFTGNDAPSLPVNWRIAESCSALHGLVATMVGVLLERKYDVQAPGVMINV